ncbi:hypothetical protein Q8A73_022134 [Channa argus]|nr:hypothetical protein Q8A73_022134 [Channa argus]
MNNVKHSPRKVPTGNTPDCHKAPASEPAAPGAPVHSMRSHPHIHTHQDRPESPVNQATEQTAVNRSGHSSISWQMRISWWTRKRQTHLYNVGVQHMGSICWGEILGSTALISIGLPAGTTQPLHRHRNDATAEPTRPSPHRTNPAMPSTTGHSEQVTTRREAAP